MTLRVTHHLTPKLFMAAVVLSLLHMLIQNGKQTLHAAASRPGQRASALASRWVRPLHIIYCAASRRHADKRGVASSLVRPGLHGGGGSITAAHVDPEWQADAARSSQPPRPACINPWAQGHTRLEAAAPVTPPPSTMHHHHTPPLWHQADWSWAYLRGRGEVL